MPLAAILDLTDDVEPVFGISCCDNSNASRLLQLVAKWTESQARRWVGHGISQNTYTDEYHRRERLEAVDAFGDYEVIGDKVYMTSESPADGHILKLDNAYVRSVTDVRVDPAGNFGTTSGSFGSSTALVSGTDYALELDAAGLCKSGHLLRLDAAWPNRPGSIKVTYVAGFSAAELNGDYSFVKEALLLEMRCKFNTLWSQQGATASAGVKKKETYHGDYSVEYMVESASAGELSEATKHALLSIRGLSL